MAGFVLANGSMSSNQSGEGNIRKALVEDDGEPFDEKMPRLIAELESQFKESSKLEAAIRTNLKRLNFPV